ncbi:hypothetical protein BGX38DRAFT_1171992 [Terfezia claveryi]|nr:hypothetical protein BGX38DRAFT_1171992 [Terfezia claveryi]
MMQWIPQNQNAVQTHSKDLLIFAKRHTVVLILGMISAIAAASLSIVGSVSGLNTYTIIGNIFWLLDVILGALVRGYFIFHRTPSSMLEKTDAQIPAGSAEAQVTIGLHESEGLESNQQVNDISINGKIDRLGGIRVFKN